MTADDLITQIKAASTQMRADDNTKATPKYLEHFSWLLFLRVFEQVENEAELVAEIDGRPFARVIDGDYRWSVWTHSGLTGDALIAFIVDDLFPHLRTRGGSPEAEKVAELFGGVTTVMKSGYVLAEVIDIVDQVDFHAGEDFHAMSVLYETLLAQMGTDAGWSGEHYTPRPIIEFIVQLIDPHIGETVYDPCAGSGGFLVASYEHMKPHISTVEDRQRLQEQTFFGQESGELPFLLGTMNMMLHGLLAPAVIRTNSLEEDIRSVAPDERYDVVLTNPPFGGKEHPQVQQNFPLKSSSTQLLFMQHILAKLGAGGKLGVVLPESFLSNTGVFETFRQKLLSTCNVHTVVSVPAKGIWYKDVKTVLLLADHGKPTEEVLYVEVVPPEGQKNFTKKKPLTAERLAPYLDLVKNRIEGERSWIEDIASIESRGWDLRPLRPPPDPALSVQDANQRISEIRNSLDALRSCLDDVDTALSQQNGDDASDWPTVRLEEVLTQRKDKILAADDVTYQRVRVALHGRGLFLRDTVKGAEIKTKTQYVVATDQFLVAEIDAKLGGMGIVPGELDGAIVSSHYFAFEIDTTRCLVAWLDLIARSSHLVTQIAAKGATNYASVRPETVLSWDIPLPALETQRALAELTGRAATAGSITGEMAESAARVAEEFRLATVAGLIPAR